MPQAVSGGGTRLFWREFCPTYRQSERPSELMLGAIVLAPWKIDKIKMRNDKRNRNKKR